MKRTEGKWESVEDGKQYFHIKTIDDDRYILATVYDRANAKRIVQTHNSFDDLLKVCKDTTKLIVDGYNKDSTLLAMAIKMDDATAEAEENYNEKN